ncbi:hypothetical protein [Paenibacillus tianjinensis]|uniref:Uncharacterized protein n=1 Tax=Paenibacillus tianjinensis TaxID=2810347 RepID=A0ABX7L9L5_9BACL|nr:hypothetical protein [Paenibacillus tianjinensis]QSF43423.1 hypothetical protein JRJ22_19355 [Paenibacillus tianjinensis]
MQKVDLVRDRDTGTYYLHRISKKGNHIFRRVVDGSQWYTQFTEPILKYKWSDIQFSRFYDTQDSELVKSYKEAASCSSKIFIKA